MAMDFSSGDFSIGNGPSVFTFPLSPNSYPPTGNRIFDDHLDQCYQLPTDLGMSSTTSNTLHLVPQQPRQQANATRTDSRLDSNLQLNSIGTPRSELALEGDLQRKSTAEESARRRREQNRASQRSYRERRDRYIEDLEQRNKFLQRHASALLEENERLKSELSRTVAQNRLAKDSTAQSSVSPASSPTFSSLASSKPDEREFLDVKETWELIQDHWLYKCGHLRVEDVYQRLKEEADVSLDGKQKKVNVVNAIESCTIGRHYDLL